MISPRFSSVTIGLLGIALVPIVIHSYVGRVQSDGRTTRVISPSLVGLTSEPTDRKERWVRDTYSSDDWIERRYTNGRNQLTLFVARSYDFKRLYHHPELGVLHGFDFTDGGTVHVPARPDVPIHLLESLRATAGSRAIYTLVYGTEFVDNPYVFQIRTAFRLLLQPRKPMTLFMVHDAGLLPSGALVDGLATRLLFQALDSFQAQRP